MSHTRTWKTSRVHFQLWLRVIFFVAPFIGVFFLPGEFADPDGSPWFLLAIITFMMLCMWPFAFAAHWVVGSEDGLRLRYWPILTRTVPYANIASVDYRSAVSPWEFAGIGLRIASGGVLAFANRKGPGFGIRTTDGRSYYVVLADDQELARVRDSISAARPDIQTGDRKIR
ncbi:hypothetical protein [Jonesia quinghaiensis]|uniref:hypothetical protein n=1 Tax=Jonesia quinghaiensis TaxID=262806 RepID=UPI000491FF5D|nr:hypothetical protein [Jonesia quinghaiensis]